MAKASLIEIQTYCDKLLEVATFPDYDGAYNGLQVQNGGVVTRIAAAVDASHATVKLAIEKKASLLIVHHGLFWSVRQPWTRTNYDLMRLLVDNDLAVYSVHLPLDAHPDFGNNVLLCRALNLTGGEPFGSFKDRPIGLKAQAAVARDELARRLAKATGTAPRVIAGGPSTCKTIGVVTGGAGSRLAEAAAAGCDTFITGEGPHHTFAQAEELGINVLYGGHYATETFGVKALAEHLSQKFDVPWVFLDYPSGL